MKSFSSAVTVGLPREILFVRFFGAARLAAFLAGFLAGLALAMGQEKKVGRSMASSYMVESTITRR
jgi:hypothetical protein